MNAEWYPMTVKPRCQGEYLVLYRLAISTRVGIVRLRYNHRGSWEHASEAIILAWAA